MNIDNLLPCTNLIFLLLRIKSNRCVHAGYIGNFDKARNKTCNDTKISIAILLLLPYLVYKQF